MKTSSVLKILLHLISGVLAVLLFTRSIAEAATVKVKVTIIAPPPCTINNGLPIEVEFGEIMTTRLDGNQYSTPVDYSLDCSTAVTNALKIQVRGNSASFGDGKLLRTNKEGLGIRLLWGDNEMPINIWGDFTYPNIPKLRAVPVKRAEAMLTEGEFTASATLQVSYQ